MREIEKSGQNCIVNQVLTATNKGVLESESMNVFEVLNDTHILLRKNYCEIKSNSLEYVNHLTLFSLNQNDISDLSNEKN